MIIKKFLNVMLWSLLAVCSSLEAVQLGEGNHMLKYFRDNFRIYLDANTDFSDDEIRDMSEMYSHAQRYAKSSRATTLHPIPGEDREGRPHHPGLLIRLMKDRIGTYVPEVREMETIVDISRVPQPPPAPPRGVSSATHGIPGETSSPTRTASRSLGSRTSAHKSGTGHPPREVLEDGGPDTEHAVVKAIEDARRHSARLLETPRKPVLGGKGKKEAPWSLPPPGSPPPKHRPVFSPPPGKPPAGARRTGTLTPSPGALVVTVRKTPTSTRSAPTTLQQVYRQGFIKPRVRSDTESARKAIARAHVMQRFLGEGYSTDLEIHGTPPPPPPSEASSTASGASRPVRKKRPSKKPSTLPSEGLQIKAAVDRARSIPMSSEKEEIANALRNARSSTHEEARRASKRQKS